MTKSFRLSAICLVAGILLAGCSTVERFDVPRDAGNIPSVKTIVSRVTCELASLARDPQYAAILNSADFVVAVQLDLTVNDDGSLAPTFSYTNGVFSFNAGAKVDVQREQNYTEQFFYRLSDFKDLAEEDAKNSVRFGKVVDSTACPDRIETPLAGEIGIKDTFHMSVNATNVALNTPLNGTKGAFGGYVTFVLLKNLNAVGPTWTLKHFKGPGGLAGLSETNTDKVTFAFAERSPVRDTGKPRGMAAAKTMDNVMLQASTAKAKVDAQNLLAAIQTTQNTNALIALRADLR